LHPDVARYCIVPPADAEAVGREFKDLATILATPRHIRVISKAMQPALLKLFTPLVDADVVAWLDCDMVMCRPSAQLWDVEPGEVLAVMDNASKIRDMIPCELQPLYEKQFPGLIEQRGFNGGFFALIPREWRHLPELYEVEFEAGGYPYHTKIWDQPFLNGLMRRHVRYLPKIYNAHHVNSYSIPKDVCIVHFTNVTKPWMPGYPKHEPAYYYWLRYGLGERRRSKLLAAKARIWARTPRRVAVAFLRAHGFLPALANTAHAYDPHTSPGKNSHLVDSQ
jgi:lipopolysaccharide biosynthesis glycosyltransferase